MLKQISEKFWRSLTYAALILYAFSLGFNYHMNGDDLGVIMVFALGFVALIVENLFIIKYSLAHMKFKGLKAVKAIVRHNLNHIFYPVVLYLSFFSYLVLYDNERFLIILISMTFFAIWLYYYFIFDHLSEGHIDTPGSELADHHADFATMFFKLYSFFILSLALFQGVNTSKIDYNLYFIFILSFTFIYLMLHLNRLSLISSGNIFFALIFSVVSSLFSLMLFKDNISYLQPFAATTVFYLTSGIFHHKLEGTLFTSVVMEYALIAIIVSVFLFAN